MIFMKESVVQCNILCVQNHTKKQKLDNCLMSIDCQYKGRNLCRENLLDLTLICVGKIEIDMPLNLKYWKRKM